MLIFVTPCAALTKLYESFENNSSPPAGWNTEFVSGTNTLTFVTATDHPSGYSAYNKGFMVKFDSYTLGTDGGVMRLKMTTPVTSGASPTVEFAWLESSAYTSGHDKVEVEWCTDGSSWSSACTFERLNATEGWKIKTCALPSGAAYQSTLYLAFKFTANNGNDCYLDHVHLTAPDSSIGDWTTMSSFTHQSLKGIWGSSAADVFAVGYDGALVHYDGSTWNSMTDYYKYIFSSVWGSSATNVYAPGNIFAESWKTIMNYNGTSWSGVASPDNYIYGIWGTSASDVFAVGHNGRILHYNGSTWSTQTSFTTDGLYGVWGSSATDVFAVGGACLAV